ncbi:MAG: inner membrane protein YpjD [Thiothrix sp.]
MTIAVNLFAAIAWLATWLLIRMRLRERLGGSVPRQRTLLIAVWLVALIVHGLSILNHVWQTHGVVIHFTAAGSLVMWLSSLLLFVVMLKRPLETLGLFIVPPTLVAMLLPWLASGNTAPLYLNNGLGVHILVSLLAYSMLTLAALQALVLAWQNRHLHNHQPVGVVRTLPPLLDMEALLFKLLLLGVILLAFGLLSGALYVDNLFAQHLVHKTVLSIIALIIFTGLLLGRWLWGWRGRMAIRWTLGGFVVLMLAFFGSKFVLEFLVTRP